ncbi:MAG: MarR family winged helix-turn-helix transcriptional regulator [Thermomicrobiales bacterium]
MESSPKRPVPLPDAIAHHTGIVLYRVAQYVQERLDQALRSHGFKTRHYSVLGVLAHAGPMSQQAIAGILRIDRAVMVAIVDDLERLGLVERRRNARDRRLNDLTLTEAGHATLREADALLEAMERDLFSPLREKEQRQLHDLLSRLLVWPTD